MRIMATIYGLEPRKNSENKEILGGFLHADNGESKKNVGLIDEIGGINLEHVVKFRMHMAIRA